MPRPPIEPASPHRRLHAIDDIKLDDAATEGTAPAPIEIRRPDGTTLREVGPESETRGGADAERDPALPED